MCNFRMQLKSFLKFTKITLKLVKLFVNERRNDCVRIDYTNQHTADESQNFTQYELCSRVNVVQEHKHKHKSEHKCGGFDATLHR